MILNCSPLVGVVANKYRFDYLATQRIVVGVVANKYRFDYLATQRIVVGDNTNNCLSGLT